MLCLNGKGSKGIIESDRICPPPPPMALLDAKRSGLVGLTMVHSEDKRAFVYSLNKDMNLVNFMTSFQIRD